MRYRIMASYRGAPYEAGVGPAEGDVVLFAACPPPEELGFEPATGHWRKQLRIEEVQALWESRPVGRFRGERCIVLDDLGDRLHIGYLGHDAYHAEQLGYWQVDRGVFELVTPREEVSDIVEERLDYPLRAAVTQPSVPQPAAAPGYASAGTPSGLGGIPAAGESQLPLEAAARRAASARGLVPSGPAEPQPVRRVPHTGPQPVLPAHTAPQPVLPAHTGPQPVLPAHTAPQPVLPAHTGPQPVLPAHTGPQPVLPAHTGPQPVLPAHTGPQPVLPAHTAPQPVLPAHTGPQPVLPAEAVPPGPDRPQATRRRRSAISRQATQRIFSELASLAAIPPSAYAVGEEVDGAMCLIQTPDGYEVFNAAAGARHEVRIFDDEESAYFYLFGVLAAEAVRTGRLAPQG